MFLIAPGSNGWTTRSRASGAEIELVPGTRQDCADAALRESANIFYASHNWHPFFLQGTKTLAYELWEDLGFQAPDNVIVPCGAGSNVLGCGVGFSELLRAGQIDRLPRIFAAQPAHCAPIAREFLGLDPSAPQPTIAEGTAIVGAFRFGATVLERQPITYYVADQHSDFFIRNLIVILAEERLGFPVYWPAAFCIVSLNDWDDIVS